MTRMADKQQKKQQVKNIIAVTVLAIVAIIGFFLMLNSIGTLDGDYIVISTQLSLDIRSCITGFTLIVLSSYFYRNMFNNHNNNND